jgi:hypothetical protein
VNLINFIVATLGTDNVYLLSGGINDFAIDFPSFIEGSIPHGLVSSSPGM